MRLQFPQLATSLKQGLAPVFLICGDEPFQLGEAANLIRQAARAGGFEEREVLEVDGHFDWGRLMAVARSLSLFSSRKLIELRLASGKIGREGGEAVRDYCARPLAANRLLILAPDLEYQELQAKWIQVVERAGVLLQVKPLEGQINFCGDEDPVDQETQPRAKYQQGGEKTTHSVILLGDWASCHPHAPAEHDLYQDRQPDQRAVWL